MKFLGVPIWLAALAWALLMIGWITWKPAGADEPRREYVRVTYYLPTGNVMRSGDYPYVGAAACGSLFPMGTILEFPDGFNVECLDTGRLASAQVDVFAPERTWGRENVTYAYGDYTTVTVIRFGWGE